MILYYWVLRGIACFSLRRNSPARFSFLIHGTTSSKHILKRVALLHLSKAPERFINRISIEKSSRTSGRRVASCSTAAFNSLMHTTPLKFKKNLQENVDKL
jgi:hypothetical protein